MSNKQNISCTVIKTFRAPKKDGNQVIYKEFKLGERIKGTLLDARMFITDSGFIIPKDNLKPIITNSQNDENIEYAEVIEDKPKIVILPKDIKSNMTGALQVKSKTAVQGAIVGLVIGFAYAMAKGKSKILFSAIGSVGGFVLGNLYNKYINEEQK